MAPAPVCEEFAGPAELGLAPSQGGRRRLQRSGCWIDGVRSPKTGRHGAGPAAAGPSFDTLTPVDERFASPSPSVLLI